MQAAFTRDMVDLLLLSRPYRAPPSLTQEVFLTVLSRVLSNCVSIEDFFSQVVEPLYGEDATPPLLRAATNLKGQPVREIGRECVCVCVCVCESE